MLNPLAEARALIEEAARLLDADKLHEEAHDADRLARRLARIETARKAREDRATQLHDRECALYELTTGRDFDRWARTASVGEIERQMGVA